MYGARYKARYAIHDASVGWRRAARVEHSKTKVRDLAAEMDGTGFILLVKSGSFGFEVVLREGVGGNNQFTSSRCDSKCSTSDDDRFAAKSGESGPTC